MAGGLGAIYDGWRDGLIRMLAHSEAYIDFPDEDLPDTIFGEIATTTGDLIAKISNHLDDGQRGERLRDGVYIVILGPPNVGKSSLLNLLACRDAAIVSRPQARPRDVIEVHLDLAVIRYCRRHGGASGSGG